MKILVPGNAATISDMIQRSQEAGHSRLRGNTREERRANFFRDIGLDKSGKPSKEDIVGKNSVYIVR